MSSPTIVDLPPAPCDAPSVPEDTSPRLSSSWQPDPSAHNCNSCHRPFDALQRKHHCRLCGLVFCQSCTSRRSLIPPTALVLRSDDTENITFVSQSNRVDGGDDLISNGPSLEYRINQARVPQRTCEDCRIRLAPLQQELIDKNSNAVRFNFVNAAGLRSLCNSPLAFTLGHEVRKAAYALGNLLPKGGRMGAIVTTDDQLPDYSSYPPREADPCKNNFKVDLTLRNVDNVHIPSRLLRKAKGIAIVTCAKGGIGFAGIEFGTGLVVSRTSDDNDSEMSWSAPSAIGLAGFALGAIFGAQVSDHIFLLMTNEAVRLFSTNDSSFQLGVDVAVAVGPIGRSAEADLAASRSNGTMAMAPIYSYSLSKGLYAGLSMDGRVVITRPRVNENFYGRTVRAEELLNGSVPRPPAAQPLYDAIKRSLVYGDSVGGSGYGVPNVGSSRSEGDASTTSSSPRDGGERNNIVNGGLLERLSHSTGLRMPVASPRVRAENPYNLNGRHDPTWQPNFSE